MLLLEYHPRGLLVTGDTFEAKEHLKALEGKWDATLKAWRWDFDEKRSVLAGLKKLRLEVQDRAKAHLVIQRGSTGLLVTGETFYVKTGLREAGATWEPKLKGWVFDQHDDLALQKALKKTLEAEVTVTPTPTPRAELMVLPQADLVPTPAGRRLVGKQTVKGAICKTSMTSRKKNVSKADGSGEVSETHTKRREVKCAKTKKALETNTVTRSPLSRSSWKTLHSVDPWQTRRQETKNQVIETRSLLPDMDLLSLQLKSKPKVTPTLALNHKARRQRAKARSQIPAKPCPPAKVQARTSVKSIEIGVSEFCIRQAELDGILRFSSLGSTLQQFLFALGLWASHGASHAVVTATGAMPWPSVHIGSLSQLLLKRERKNSNASALEDLGIWTFKTPEHLALLHLRSCRVKLIQRFGGVDKAYIRCVPALTGMTRDVFRQLANMMGFTDEDSFEMYDLMKSHRPPKKRRASVSGSSARSSKAAEQEEPMDRNEFGEAMRKAMPVKGLIQLRRRLRMKHSSCEAATTAAFGKRQALDREAFRDFMIQNGISGREAYQHFMRMTKHNESGGLAEIHTAHVSGHEDAPQEVTRFAFLKTLLHAEGHGRTWSTWDFGGERKVSEQ
ncbi:unnamed protein product [Cladocopium goreaui]|uniref:Uncharacterized protein n=1 Tax=Cladocopium goreaui TaxID=2562237 RepID=A0A9P1G4P0_9DINO|nr:unnamed protein product [Cladocopium goreaui]